MAIPPGIGTVPATGATPVLPSEREFIRALRDHALMTVQVLDQEVPVAGLTPAELEDRTELSRPSVAGLIKRFEAILERQQQDGRPAGSDSPVRRWSINATAGVIVGVELGRHDDALVTTSDLFGRIGDVTAVPSAGTADDLIDDVVKQIRELAGDRATNVVGIGVSLAAPVHADSGQPPAVASPPHEDADRSPWSDWQLMRVREQLRFRLGWANVPVRLDNDANLSALAQFVWGAARPTQFGSYRNVVYVEWSRGIGAGLILNGQLYRGAGVAGEIGHTVVADAPCPRCGNTGCLEAIAGWEAIIGSAASRPRQKELEAALRAARDDSEGPMADRFKAAAWVVGQVLGPTIHLLNPQLVIVGGDVATLGYDVVRPQLLKSLKRHTMRPALADVTVVPAEPLDHAALRGAIALILVDDLTAVVSFLQRRAA